MHFPQFNTLFKRFLKNSTKSIGVTPIRAERSICMFLPCFRNISSTMRYTPLLIGRKTSLSPLADHNSRVLILDTMPGEKSLILQQYYACKSNFFWKIIFKGYQRGRWRRVSVRDIDAHLRDFVRLLGKHRAFCQTETP